MKIQRVITYIFAIIALIFEGFFGFIPLVSFIIQVILIGFALFLLVWSIRSLFRRESSMEWKRDIYNYTLAISSGIGILIFVSLGFIGYQNFVPGVVSDITLSNSGQKVVFVEMSHIATSEFYLKKKNTIAALTQSGYTILFEGVKPGTQENQELFNRTVGFDFTPTLYAELSRIIGLQSQDHAMLFAGISTGSLINVDLSIDEIVSLMGTGNITEIGEVLNIENEIQRISEALTPRERILVGWIGRGLLNWSLRKSDDIDAILNGGSQARFFETIIDRRNDKIIEYIEKHPNENIAIVYGALHFNGVYEGLQKKNKKWSIIQIQTSEPYSR